MAFFDSVHDELKKGINDLASQLRYLQGLDDTEALYTPSPANASGTVTTMDNEFLDQLSQEQSKELAWQQELAARSAQLMREKELQKERRRERDREKEEWDARLKEREEELLRREWEAAERQLEAARLKEWEEEERHEKAREEAFRKDLLFERDLQKRTLDAMESEHAAAAARLARLLADGTVDEVLKAVPSTEANPAANLSVNQIVDTQLSEEMRKLRASKRDQERGSTLESERERQRNLEKKWAQQRVEDKLREEEARKIREQVARGEVMDLKTLQKLRRRALTEEEKAQVPAYVVSSLLRTMAEVDDRETVIQCVKILSRLLHGPESGRKHRVCEAMISCMSGLRSFVEVMNKYSGDVEILRTILPFLKLAGTYSRSFAVAALQEGIWDMANATKVPGFHMAPFRDITHFTPQHHEAAVRQTLGTLEVTIAQSPPETAACKRCLISLKTEILQCPPAMLTVSALPALLFDMCILVQDETVWTYALELLATANGRGATDAVCQMLVTEKGRAFVTHVLKMTCLANDDALVLAALEFVVTTWSHDKEVASLYVELKAWSAFVLASDNRPAVRDTIFQRWESSGVGTPDIQEILECVAECDSWDSNLRHYLFDAAVRFHPGQVKRDGPSLSEQAVAFLSAGQKGQRPKGPKLLKQVAADIPQSREAIVHILWAMVQVQEHLQFVARLAEELTESDLLQDIVDFLADPSAVPCLGHAMEVVDFCAQNSPDADEKLHTPENEQILAKVRTVARGHLAVGPEATQQVEMAVKHLGIKEEESTLEEIFSGLPKDPSESNILVVRNTLQSFTRAPRLTDLWRTGGGVSGVLQLLEQWAKVPEVEVSCITTMACLLRRDGDGLNAAVSDEFCEAGGIDAVIGLLNRYSDNEPVTVQCWDILADACHFASAENSAPLRTNDEIWRLLAVTRTGHRLVAFVLKGIDVLDTLKAVIEAIHAVEGQNQAVKEDDDVPATAKATKDLSKSLKENPLLERLVVTTFFLNETLKLHVSPTSVNPALSTSPTMSASDFTSVSWERVYESKFAEALRLVEEGAARTLCRCLEAATGCVPASTVADIFSVLQVLLCIGQNSSSGVASVGEKDAGRLDNRPTTPIRTLNFLSQPGTTTGPKKPNSLPEMQMAVRLKSHVQIRSRIETIVATMGAYYWSEEICDKTVGVLHELLMSVGSIDDDDLANRLVKSTFVEYCFECMYDHGVSKGLLSLLQCVSAVEDTETLVWELGGFDTAYSIYHMTDDETTKAMAVACLANHANFDVERRGFVLSMGGLQMATLLLRGAHNSWEENWAGMKMLAAVAEPSEPFILQTIGDGLTYIIAERLSSVAVLRHTRAAAQCLCRLLHVGLTFREPFKEKRNMIASNGQADLSLWLSDDSLTSPLELLLYRVQQLFIEHVHDIETIDYTTQFVATLLSMRSPAIVQRLLRCNTRLLLTNILAYKNITSQITREASFCLDELHNAALTNAQAQILGPGEAPVPVDQKPQVPILPDFSLKGMWTADQADDDDQEDTPREAFEHDPEDQEYLHSIGATDLWEEMTSVLLAQRPSDRADVIKNLQRFLDQKASVKSPGKDSPVP